MTALAHGEVLRALGSTPYAVEDSRTELVGILPDGGRRYRVVAVITSPGQQKPEVP